MIIIEIAGFLGADPEERFTSTGKRVVTIRVATRVREGGQDETVWWNVDFWNNEFDNMLRVLKKGSAVIVVGEMSRKPKTYTSRSDGTTQVSLTLRALTIKFASFGRSDRPAEPQSPADMESSLKSPHYSGVGVGAASSEHESAVAGDDLPF